MKTQRNGTMYYSIKMTIKIAPEISFWDALKMRLMGRRPAAILLWRMVKMMEDAT